MKYQAGHRWGRLSLLRREKDGGVHYMVCLCDCGTEVRVRACNIYGDNTRSCGCLRREACRERERRKNHPTHGVMLAYYKRNAKVRGLDWRLSSEDFTRLISGDCHYCGSAPGARVLVGRTVVANGIDRINNEVGYEDSNVVSCCTTCNRAKGSMSEIDFMAWVLRVAEHQKGGLPDASLLH